MPKKQPTAPKTGEAPKRQRSAPRKGAASAASSGIAHLAGCPAERIESHEAIRPADGAAVTVTRCIDCGATADTKEQS